MASGMAIEIILTFGFLMIILGSTDTRAPAGFAPIAIGLGLTLIHLISIPITNTSVNPARSTGPALIQGGMALQQLWMFWVAPLIGGVLGGLAYRCAGCGGNGGQARDHRRTGAGDLTPGTMNRLCGGNGREYNRGRLTLFIGHVYVSCSSSSDRMSRSSSATSRR